jgi:hypothetical protein
VTSEITTLRLCLIARGYTPLPARGKEVHLAGWSRIVPTADDVAHWGVDWPTYTNTGILTRDTPAIDIDITEQVVASAVENLLIDHFGKAGTILRRVGRAPKRAILFQTAEPFDKRLAVFAAPNGEIHRIEILARGQQVIAYGIHPDTRQPYLWQPAGPVQTDYAHLPVITAESADRFMSAAISFLKRECGWELLTKSTRSEPRRFTYTSRVNIRAVGGLIKIITGAIEGNRNKATFWAACRAGDMIKAGWFSRETAHDVLLEAALKTGISEHSALATIRSGLRTTGN